MCSKTPLNSPPHPPPTIPGSSGLFTSYIRIPSSPAVFFFSLKCNWLPSFQNLNLASVGKTFYILLQALKIGFHGYQLNCYIMITSQTRCSPIPKTKQRKKALFGAERTCVYVCLGWGLERVFPPVNTNYIIPIRWPAQTPPPPTYTYMHT